MQTREAEQVIEVLEGIRIELGRIGIRMDQIVEAQAVRATAAEKAKGTPFPWTRIDGISKKIRREVKRNEERQKRHGYTIGPSRFPITCEEIMEIGYHAIGDAKGIGYVAQRKIAHELEQLGFSEYMPERYR